METNMDQLMKEKEILYDEIPSLDLADFYKGNAAQKQKFVNDLGAAYHSIGFVAIKNHFLTDDMQQKLYTSIKKFFALPDQVKQKYELPGLAGQRGYIGKGKEHAKGRNTGDLKEFYHVGQELSQTDLKKEGYPANVWPSEVAELSPVAVDVYRALEKTGTYMLRAIAIYLELPETYFDDKIKHGDINLITLLMGASADGLQVLRRDGKWIPITALPDQLVVNVGDMLERLTNKKLKSTIHRVVNPPRHLMNTPRYSIPFFMHPRSEMSLAALPDCVDADNPKQWEDITAGEFLDQRLAEIGLKKK
jgi:isopenicillin N synthase-like dioxygenase